MKDDLRGLKHTWFYKTEQMKIMVSMKKVLFLIVAIVLPLSLSAQEKSLWMLHNRLTGAYVYDDGNVQSLALSPSGDTFLWTMESGEGDDFTITNLHTGRPLMCDDTFWVVGGYDFANMPNVGWYSLERTGKTGFLAVRGNRLVGEAADRVGDYSAHWSFVRVHSEKSPFVIGRDGVVESSFRGERTAKALSTTEMTSDYHRGKVWKLSQDISSFPQFTAEGNTLVPALYNLALEETLLDIRPQDSTFMAGMLWPDTWTRDVVYSIYFAYSWLLPDVARRTLEKQTLHDPDEALQDTGSGGSYPISTDRVVWALAAWEYYLATGDKDWLRQTYRGLSNTARKDLHVAYDHEIHLFRGETCSMDWRTHTYPNWFTNAHIGESFSCGTNALHLFLYRFLCDAGRVIGAPGDEISLWEQVHQELRDGINSAFWDETTGLYKCYLYPGFLGYRPSARVGGMSNGLAVLLGVADRERAVQVLSHYPMYAYGASVLYPSKPDSYAYHNKSIWPVWQTPLMYSAKKYGNGQVVRHLMESAVRAGAMFLTHKENMTYDTGYDGNTALNSDRQLWSVASYISIVYRILFGISIDENGLTFSPMVPEWMGEKMSLTGFKYRRATLDIEVKGKGDEIAAIKVNGKKRTPSYVLPANAKGKFHIEITMGPSVSDSKATIVPVGPGNCWSPVEPTVVSTNNLLSWTPQPGCTYRLYGSDTMIDNIHSPYDIGHLPSGWYSISAVDADGRESDLSNPVMKSSYVREYAVGIKDFRESHQDFDIPFEVPSDGDYYVWFTGTNGRGPHNTFCAIRSMYLDGIDTATLLLEAYGDWNVRTLSNHVLLKGLKAGKHTITIRLNPENKNFDSNMSYNKENWNDWTVESMTVAAH